MVVAPVWLASCSADTCPGSCFSPKRRPGLALDRFGQFHGILHHEFALCQTFWQYEKQLVQMNRRRVLTILIALLATGQWCVGAVGILLTNATQVRALTVVEAKRHFPVQLHGVVLGQVDPGGRALVLYDGSSCIYLIGPQKLISPMREGDQVVVEGVSGPGQFAPIVVVRKLNKVGRGKIPRPKRVTFAQMLSGSLDAQWVEITGIVRECNPSKGNPWQSDMVLETDAHRLEVRINNRLKPGAYVDAKITLRGFCFSQENDNRQLTSPMLYVPHNAPVQVDDPSAADPYKLPLRSVRSLFQFEPHSCYEYWVRLRGVVTYYRPGKFLCIRDGDAGLRVECSQTKPLQPGDEVDVVGFPALGNYAPVLEDAVFKKDTISAPPSPVLLTNSASALLHDQDLVCLNARLIERVRADSGWDLLFDWNHERIKGMLELPKNQPLPSSWRDGSEIRVTGICSIISDQNAPISGAWEPSAFALLLRSPADLRVIRMASWWTESRIIQGLGILSVFLASIIGVIIFAARRRLHEQAMHRSQAEREFSAILNERNRIAREIHDTVAQGLGAISMRLELAKKQLLPGANGAASDLALAHSLVRSTLAETRNSVWHLHSQVLDTADLATALGDVLRVLTEETDIQSEFSVRGESQRLPPVVENNLLRAGQEAITNAVKHAQPRKISVTLDFLDRMVRLRVCDDGKGFDSKKPPRSDGGFGLVGMSERIKESNGKMILQSSPQCGTEVILEAPVTN